MDHLASCPSLVVVPEGARAAWTRTLTDRRGKQHAREDLVAIGQVGIDESLGLRRIQQVGRGCREASVGQVGQDLARRRRLGREVAEGSSSGDREGR